MWSKYVAILLLVSFESRLTNGQIFRKGYVFVKALNSFYKINTGAKTWAQAQATCFLEGATLFYPADEEEALEVATLWNKTHPNINQLFIGVANWNVNDLYESVDGKPISDIYNNWEDGEPCSADEEDRCVIMQRDGTLKIEDCSYRHAYICKKTLATLQWNKECNIPDPQYKYNKTLDRCYKFHLAPKNWTDAYTICKYEESYLAIINSADEDKYFIKLIAEAPKDDVQGNYLRGAVHLGFQDKKGVWETIKGVPLDDSGFGGGWANTQPDGGGNETCGSMFYTGELNDIGCWQRMFFICEHEIDRSS